MNLPMDFCGIFEACRRVVRREYYGWEPTGSPGGRLEDAVSVPVMTKGFGLLVLLFLLDRKCPQYSCSQKHEEEGMVPHTVAFGQPLNTQKLFRKMKKAGVGH